MAELGIVDIREINRVIKSLYDYDFSNHALTSYKQRLEKIMKTYLISSPDGLMRKLHEERSFFDTFLYEASVPSTEMFRDPSLWRWLREEYFPNHLEKSTNTFRIWIPACVSGAELYSLAILLTEMDLIDKVQITASCVSEKSMDAIRTGLYDPRKLEVSLENYKRYNGSRDLTQYYKSEKETIILNSSLIRTADLKKLNINFDNAPQNVKLILFRNNLIYYNPARQESVLQIMWRALSVSGHIVLGIREKISGISSARDYELINETESVYRKKL